MLDVRHSWKNRRQIVIICLDMRILNRRINVNLDFIKRND